MGECTYQPPVHVALLLNHRSDAMHQRSGVYDAINVIEGTHLVPRPFRHPPVAKFAPKDADDASSPIGEDGLDRPAKSCAVGQQQHDRRAMPHAIPSMVSAYGAGCAASPRRLVNSKALTIVIPASSASTGCKIRLAAGQAPGKHPPAPACRRPPSPTYTTWWEDQSGTCPTPLHQVHEERSAAHADASTQQREKGAFQEN